MADVVVRPATREDAVGIAQVHVEVWRDTYPLLLPADYLANNLDVVGRLRFWRQALSGSDGANIFVAEADDDAIVGFASGGMTRESEFDMDAELYAIYVVVDFQDQGIGRELVRFLACSLRRDGRSAMAVEVLEGNPARFFYEAMGARRIAVKQRRFAGKDLPSVIYAWPDLIALCPGAGR